MSHLLSKITIAILLALPCAASFAVSNNPQDPLIMFVCGGNIGRSPMAEYMANYYFAFPTHGYQVDSRGANVDLKETHPEKNAIIVMSDLNIDLSKHRAKQIVVADINKATLILTMTKTHKNKVLALEPAAKNVYMLSECADGTQTDISDAYGKDLFFYKKTRDQIKMYLQEIYAHKMKCSPLKDTSDNKDYRMCLRNLD
jgi:protein-tyrosine phosphatase